MKESIVLTLMKRTASAAVEAEGGGVIVEGGRVSICMLPPDVTVVFIPGFVEMEACEEDELDNEPDDKDFEDFDGNKPAAIAVPLNKLVAGIESVAEELFIDALLSETGPEFLALLADAELDEKALNDDPALDFDGNLLPELKDDPLLDSNKD